MSESIRGDEDWVDVLRSFGAALSDLDPAGEPAGRIDQLDALERLVCGARAAQARIAATHDDCVPASTPTRSRAAEVALARHESPHRGGQLLGLARALTHDLPETLAALARGDINERRAEIIARETQDLTATDRRDLDTLLHADPTVTTLGNRALGDFVRRAAIRTDSDTVEARRTRAARERHVTFIRLPDGMCRLTAEIEDIHAAAISTMLGADVEAITAAGEANGRSRAQLRADALTARLTGQVGTIRVPMHLNVLISAEALLTDEDNTPAEIPGHGPVPAAVIRKLAATNPRTGVVNRIRRLFHYNGTLVAMETTSRRFDGLLAEFIRMRDQHCRTPWCDAPIRHLDHIRRHADGGPTSVTNAQGHCETCNYTKETTGWDHHTQDDAETATHTVEITTPTGHRHRTTAPPPPTPPTTWVEISPGRWTLAV